MGMRQPGKVLSIRDLNRYLKLKLDGDAVLQDVWVRGEISNFTHHGSGHMYFTLKDAQARIRAIMFQSHNQRLSFFPKEGMMVLARGNVTVFERDGQVQLYIMEMQPDGIGNLYMAYERLKSKLEAEGLFAADVKRPIPRFPRCVGVVTSPTGAAVRDILITLRRRYPAAAVLFAPVLVQGPQAAASIVQGIERMNRCGEPDVLIVGRGGGSLEELWPFNEESVARAIRASAIPVISAVGHETDVTIADFVADLRAATPTAAAELAVPHRAELSDRLETLTGRLANAAAARASRYRERLEAARRSPVMRHPHRYFLQQAEVLDRLRDRLRFAVGSWRHYQEQRLSRVARRLGVCSPEDRLSKARADRAGLERMLLAAMRAQSKEAAGRLIRLTGNLDMLSPLKVMQRGYGLVYAADGRKLIKSARMAEVGDRINVRLSDGILACTVEERTGEEKGHERA